LSRQSSDSMQTLPKFRSTITGSHPMTSPSALRSTSHAIDRGRHRNVGTDRLGSLGPYIRRSTGLSLFLPGPQPVARLGRNPQRRSNLRVVVQPFGYPNPHRRFASPWQGLRPFRSRRHPSTLTSYSSQNVYSQQGTNYHQTGGCTRLPSSHLYHLPMSPTANQSHCQT